MEEQCSCQISIASVSGVTNHGRLFPNVPMSIPLAIWPFSIKRESFISNAVLSLFKISEAKSEEGEPMKTILLLSHNDPFNSEEASDSAKISASNLWYT